MVLEKLRLDGKVAIVTGGGTGLGKAMCHALAQAGADIVVSARRTGPIEETAAEVRQMGRRSLAISCDVTQSAQVDQMVQQALKEFGHIDILLNNAGIVRGEQLKPLWEISDEQWRLGIDTNLTGTFYCCRAVSKHMADRGKGKIINVASGAGLRGMRDNYTYCAAKGGVITFTRALAISWGQYGITCNCIIPGFFLTEPVIERRPQIVVRGDFIPVGRIGDPQDLGPLAVFLASEASDYMTGELFISDGGGLSGAFAPTGYAPLAALPSLREG